MANTTYTVVSGDTLSKIAAAHNTTVDKLVSLNALPDPNYIVVGQVLIVSGTAVKVRKNTTSQAKIRYFGLQSNSQNTMYATWLWDKSNTEHYAVRWYYDTGDGVWFVGADTTTDKKQSTYTAPDTTKRVRFVVQPVSKTRTVNKKETKYWTAKWSTDKIYDFINNPPTVPPVPAVSIKDLQLTAKLENLDVNGTSVQFKVVQNDDKVYKLETVEITSETKSATFVCTVATGSSYKVACRAVRATLYSDWSDFSAEQTTIPATPTKFTECKASSETSVYLKWDAIETATSYDVQYAEKVEHLDSSNLVSIESGIEETFYELGNLGNGVEYFFRFRAVNNDGESGWSAISSIPVGKKPIAPTTWSSTTTAVKGEPLNLYWVHNCEDGSNEKFADLEMLIDGVPADPIRITKSTDPEEAVKTSVYPINTAAYPEGAQIQWRVRTAGVTNEVGEWSIQRTIDIHALATITVSIEDKEGNALTEITQFPFYVEALAGPKTQAPIGYHLSIISNEMYETVDDLGNIKVVSKGEEVYSKHFDISSMLLVEFSANNVDLENNKTYTFVCSVTMNSGLTAENKTVLKVSWTDVEYEPSAEIGIDETSLTAHIRPYCEDEDGNLIENLYLSVYRREFDGTFTEIIKNIDNSDSIFVTDPHPSLDYARYRIVATDKTTGAVCYSDIPAFPVGEVAVVIQWDEEWSSFDATISDAMAEPEWSGSMLKLPYNIDVNDMHNADVAMIEYIGRKRPVSYYGTQLGETSTWNVDIPKYDKDTLYALRRLAIWMGNVYVREPSGSGYWANVAVSFNQKHRDLTIPVTLNIKRVEGGM